MLGNEYPDQISFKRVGVEMDDDIVMHEHEGRENSQEPEKNLQMPIFTYTLEDGVSEGSYGINCAIVAGLPETVVKMANANSKNLDRVSKAIQKFDFGQIGAIEKILDDSGLDLDDRKRKLLGQIDEGTAKILKIS